MRKTETEDSTVEALTPSQLFIANMKKFRRRGYYTQETFAEAIGVKRSLVGAWDEGRSCPSVDKMLKICELFEVDLTDMLTKEFE